MKHRQISLLRVIPSRPGSAPDEGRLIAGATIIRCKIGAAGLVHAKREGDRGTPVGCYRLLGGFFRADRMRRLQSGVPIQAARPADIWCDDPRVYAYNRHRRAPIAASHERLWREDHAYDVVLVVDYNLWPRKLGAGSAIFIHLMQPGQTPTAGCVALDRNSMRKLLPRLSRNARIWIG